MTRNDVTKITRQFRIALAGGVGRLTRPGCSDLLLSKKTVEGKAFVFDGEVLYNPQSLNHEWWAATNPANILAHHGWEALL